VKPRIRKPLRKGSLVYHGTSSEEEFTALNGPVWVSGAEAVARSFVHWNRGGGIPRVLVYRVIEAPRLAVAESKVEFMRFVGWVEEKIGDDASDGSYEFAEQICDNWRLLGIDGWHLPKNYQDGSDTMLCDPDQFLEYVETIEVRST
jgi:hypothetical protein